MRSTNLAETTGNTFCAYLGAKEGRRRTERSSIEPMGGKQTPMIITALHRQQDHTHLAALVILWKRDLEHNDYAASTIAKYLQAIHGFLNWYEQEEQGALTLEDFFYRNLRELSYRKSQSFQILRPTIIR